MTFLNRFLIAISLISYYPITALSQSRSPDKLGTWTVFNVTLPEGKSKWGAYTEGQMRLDAFIGQLYYYEIKGGISYDIDDNFTALVGTGRYVTYDALDISSGSTSREQRLWQQLTINQYLSRLKFEHRYRIEQRWFNTGFKNRLRYRINLMIPINKSKIEEGTFFLSFFDEIFMNTKTPHFERNRISGGIGYQLNKSLTIQTSFLNQYNFTIEKSEDKNNIMFTFSYRIPGKNSKDRERIPSHLD
jgi:hypothetical protein